MLLPLAVTLLLAIQAVTASSDRCTYKNPQTDRAIDGYNIATFHDQTPDTCKEKCEANDECKSFEIRTRNFLLARAGTCDLNGRDGTEASVDRERDFDYYERDCSNITPDPTACSFKAVQNDKSITGYNLDVYDGITVDQCKIRCLKNRECKSFEIKITRGLLFRSGRCSINGRDGTETKVKRDRGYDYYERTCPPVVPDPSSCQFVGPQEDKSLNGYNVAVHRGLTVDQCKIRCDDNAECRSFEFKVSSGLFGILNRPGRCSLNSHDSSEVSLTDENGYNYYELKCPDVNSLCSFKAKRTGFSITGSNIAVWRDVTVDQCKARCLDTPGCKSFEYKTSSTFMSPPGRCSINDKDSTDGDVRADSGFDYYEVDCTEEPPPLPSICSLPKDEGDCGGKSKRYYYDVNAGTHGKCQKMVYTGCGGNANNFGSWEECRGECR